MEKLNIMLPVGRLIGGHPMNRETTDGAGNPLIYKTGAKLGQPYEKIRMRYAVAKDGRAWYETEWGSQLVQFAQGAFHGSPHQIQRPDFAWKIIDGDSTVPAQDGKLWSSKPGYAGHWVLKIETTLCDSVRVCDASNPQAINNNVQPDRFLLGDYIECYIEVAANTDSGKPGLYLNPVAVAWRAHGERIQTGVDVTGLGFGGGSLPSGASTVPLASPANSHLPETAQQTPLGAPAYSSAPGGQPAPGAIPPPHAQTGTAPAATAQPAGVHTPQSPGAVAAPQAGAASFAPPAGIAPGASSAAPTPGSAAPFVNNLPQ